MSLSFVSKTVQTAKDDGQFEEREIEPKETGGRGGSSRGSSGYIPSLFDQLRSNQEKVDAERAEEEKAIMRGTGVLDEEDKAHLEALAQQQKREQEERQRETQSAVAAFRAAQADRLEATTLTANLEKNDSLTNTAEETVVSATARPKVPAATATRQTTSVIVVGKKRRRQDAPESGVSKSSKSGDKDPVDAKHSNDAVAGKSTPAGLGGLLTGYGSSDDDED